MKSVKVVIGANYGDEGKGLMTDYFCSYLDNPLNVRFNGTCQAGHTVVSGTKRHVFSHIGSGTFASATTLLSSYFYCNPTMFKEEYLELNDMGVYPKVLVSNNCNMVSIYDVFFNRVLENKRGEHRHGSCGLGLWEAEQRNSLNGIDFSLTTSHTLTEIREQLLKIRDNYYKIKSGIIGLDKEDFMLDSMSFEDENGVHFLDFYDDSVLNAYLSDCEFFFSHVDIVDEKLVLEQFATVVFEGAQGLLLDENNVNEYPHVTASSTGMKNVWKLLEGFDYESLEVCYVTRSYLTRHGNGPFRTKTSMENLYLDDKVHVRPDKTNHTNEWQGDFKYGWFDKDLFAECVNKDSLGLDKISIAVTHLDETGGKLAYWGSDRELEWDLDLPYSIYTSYSERRCDVSML